MYAKLKMAIQSGKCLDESCNYEYEQVKRLDEAPKKSIEFLQQILDELSVTEDNYYDVNNNYSFMVANCIMTNKPGFSKTEGYNVYLNLMQDGSQEIVFEGPLFEKPLVINNNTLSALLESNTSLVIETPDVNADMLKLLVDSSVLADGSTDEEGNLLPEASLFDEYLTLSVKFLQHGTKVSGTQYEICYASCVTCQM